MYKMLNKYAENNKEVCNKMMITVQCNQFQPLTNKFLGIF